MERNKLLNLLAAILGFAALGLPANSSVPDDGPTYLFWMISAYFSSKNYEDGLQFVFSNSEHPEMLARGVPFYISFAVLAIGSVLMLLTVLPNSKLKLANWLPAVLIVAGVATYMISAVTVDIEGPVFEIFPIPIGASAGIVAAVLSIIPLVPVRGT